MKEQEQRITKYKVMNWEVVYYTKKDREKLLYMIPKAWWKSFAVRFYALSWHFDVEDTPQNITTETTTISQA